MSAARWQLRQADAGSVTALSAALGLPRPLAQVIVARGIDDVDDARRFLAPKLAQLSSPLEMADFGVALDRIVEAVVSGEQIGVFGDYDVDGVTSAAIVADYLQRSGARLVVRVARRDEGYGFHPGQAQELIDEGCRVLVLTDCGTSDREAVEHAARAGVDVIAVDHHRLAEADWPGFALLNPHRGDCGFPYKGLCSAGLAFYLTAGLRTMLAARDLVAPDPREGLDLVALGTVSDVAPLDGDNRILVARGLQALERTTRPGLRELLRISELSGKVPSAEDIAWRLGPRLNAPGRLGDASIALDCLWLRDEERATEAARSCDRHNHERREIQQRVLDQAREQAAKIGDRHFYLFAREDWHPGVIGIVAARLAEDLGRPVAMVAVEGDVGRGSVRTAAGLDVFQLLERCPGLMLRHGGHASAAGFSVHVRHLDALADALDGAAEQALRSAVAEQTVNLDGLLALQDVDLSLCTELAQLAPYGENNPEPVFGASEVTVEGCRKVGRDHLALTVRQGVVAHDAIAFSMATRAPTVGEPIDLAYAPQIDTFRGRRPRLRVLDWARAGQGIGATAGVARRSEGQC